MDNNSTDSSVIDEKTLGDFLQKKRIKANLTQQELCQKAGISYSTLAKIERGAIKSPSVFTIKGLADALNISLDNIMDSLSNDSDTTEIKKNTIEFVYFDINGCLVNFFHRAFNVLSNETGEPVNNIETIFWQYNDAVCSGEMPMNDFNNIMSETLGRAIDWQKYYMNAISPIEEMHELVKWCAGRYKIGLLSNIMPGFIPEMIQTGLIPDVSYDSIIDSSVVKAIKPDTEIFDIAESKTGVEASKILFIDDSRANIITASQLGWKVVWFDDSNPQESTSRIYESLAIS